MDEVERGIGVGYVGVCRGSCRGRGVGKCGRVETLR